MGREQHREPVDGEVRRHLLADLLGQRVGLGQLPHGPGRLCRTARSVPALERQPAHRQHRERVEPRRRVALRRHRGSAARSSTRSGTRRTRAIRATRTATRPACASPRASATTGSTGWRRGPAISRSTPIGGLEQATWSDGAINVAGWALDPSTTAPITVHVYVDGASVAHHRQRVTTRRRGGLPRARFGPRLLHHRRRRPRQPTRCARTGSA